MIHPAEGQEEPVAQLRRPPEPPGRRALVHGGGVGVEDAQGVLEPQRLPPGEAGAVRMGKQAEDLAEAPHGVRRHRDALAPEAEHFPLQLRREAEDLGDKAQQVPRVVLGATLAIQCRTGQDGLLLQDLGASWDEFGREKAHALSGAW